jgi:hypothetical protein
LVVAVVVQEQVQQVVLEGLVVAVLERHLVLERLERQTREAVAVVVLTRVLVLVLLVDRVSLMFDGR